MEKPVDSFSGIPMSTESPFVEIIWDPVRKTLAIISKIKKESFFEVLKSRQQTKFSVSDHHKPVVKLDFLQLLGSA